MSYVHPCIFPYFLFLNEMIVPGNETSNVKYMWVLQVKPRAQNLSIEWRHYTSGFGYIQNITS